VSKVPVYWHAEHSLNILRDVLLLLEQSSPADHKPTFSFLKFFVMTTGYIPRGKASAPKQTMPESAGDMTALIKKCAQVQFQIDNVDSIKADACFKHPFFGWLDKKETVRFMIIHTKHHLKIVNDIVR